ncbi:NAD(P)-dependent alcohol dehydrogenase [Mycolicibacterium thermoresistibile]|uniref:Aryl-alcohol dehydrogenase n=1 Tax=Mycolicibacterium thermoresistibile (strain ATCC 19527 / DSM 44167 / CIP 105390 / JCM 6362 / NCTC 10409 / 316) TaxID=1078020 RepID=G7CAZ7_MYCT3|nr:NAD(P)-dependent alcohol dehydrogenase [Mycolicibacterium thermoresistibile]EHI14851.1 aryl-alcohol dehydrogenase [Mycolicibacterium thermoresistibile ATCC 19527]MCV7190820.1 NAD(P)-dependent alcohol dehydrogenase [Mycolicibacterium thermoresistibile]SNW18659.1 Zn-dependent alcohol dehydrogenase, class III [Mycolicibacterium thermoresistibile]
MRIQAAVLRGETDPYQIEELDLPDPAAHQILVRIAGTGHCHTDVLPRAGAGFGTPPIVVGHEGSGVVEAVGAAVDTVAVGDHVVLSFDSCGTCGSCLAAHPAYCDTFLERNLGGPGVDGAAQLTDVDGQPVAGRWFGQSSFASHAVVDAANAVVVDKDLPLELLGPLGCGVQTGAGAVLEVLRIGPGESIVITGTGAVGLSAVMAAKVAGASTIIAVDLNTERLALAEEFGATHTIVANTGELTEQIRAIVPGGTHYGLDTTGLPAVIAAALEAVAVRGTMGLVGVQQGELAIGPLALTIGRTITGILEGDAEPRTFIPRLIELWRAGRFPFDRMIETFPLSEINTAEQRALAGEIIKPVLIPGA